MPVNGLLKNARGFEEGVFETTYGSFGGKKRMNPPQDVFTTGQVAKICNVAPRTVSKWFDTGHLRGYRIPGSKDRRIPLEQLIRFMRVHGMPLNGLDGGLIRVLVLDSDEELASAVRQALLDAGRFEVDTANGAFSGGVAAEKFRPHLILLDIDSLHLDSERLCRFLRNSEDLQGTCLLAMSRDMTDAKGQMFLQQGIAQYIQKPFDAQALIQSIDDTVSIVA